MGIGSATGENRAIDAAKAAINSPLLDVSITGAKGVLFSIAGGEDLTMFEIQDAAKVITESIDPEAKIIFGTVRDDKLKKNEIQITVIATGFPETNTAATRPMQSSGVGAFSEPTIASLMKNTEKGKIYNPSPVSVRSDREAVLEKVEVKRGSDKDKVEKPADDDDWGAIPAFLRRSRLK
jgi:cell division protein FtsZ